MDLPGPLIRKFDRIDNHKAGCADARIRLFYVLTILSFSALKGLHQNQAL